jgi:hypothetical protein
MRWIILVLSILLLGCTGTDGQAQPEENITANVTVENVTEDIVVNETELPEPEVTEEEPPIVIEDETCKDSDSGDLFTKGNVTAFKNMFHDSCKDLKVKEYTCSDGEAVYSFLECPPEYICKDGRCVRGRLKCSDTDGGNDIFVAGKVVIDSLIDATYLDKCLDGKRMREYYCEEDEYVQRDVECQTECMQGRCLQE